MNLPRYKLETAVVFIIVVALVRGIYELQAWPSFAPYVPLFVAILLVYASVLHSTFRKEPIGYLDNSFQGVGKAVTLFLVVFAIVMPLFLACNHCWQGLIYGKVLSPRMLPQSWIVVTSQLFLVALPEEFFFRGWLQSRLNRIFTRRLSVLGVQVGAGWLITALLFAVAHSVIFYQWWHFAIFFPALLFGWLREKSGGILAPILFHAFSNVAVQWIGISYT